MNRQGSVSVVLAAAAVVLLSVGLIFYFREWIAERVETMLAQALRDPLSMPPPRVPGAKPLPPGQETANPQ
jgi:hypothetical protein